MERNLPLRITLVQPPRGVVFCLQRGQTEIVSPARSAGTDLSFDFSVRVGQRPDGQPNFLGPFTQGPSAGRFVYVNSGTCAGDLDSSWTRRAKIPLSGLSWPLIEKALAASDGILEARITGTHKDGGPACATVPLLGGGWQIANAAAPPPTAAVPSVEAGIVKAVHPRDPILQEIVGGLRELVREVVLDVTETVNPWGIPTFELNGPLCHVMVATKHVSFGFARGTSLDDPKGLLEGTGKNFRHVKLRKVDDLRREGLRGLIEEAARLNRESLAPKMGRSGKP
jgi:hypothetical protein